MLRPIHTLSYPTDNKDNYTHVEYLECETNHSAISTAKVMVVWSSTSTKMRNLFFLLVIHYRS